MTMWVGTISGGIEDIPILKSLGMEIGGLNNIKDGDNTFEANIEVDDEMLELLDPLWGTFIWSLKPKIGDEQ